MQIFIAALVIAKNWKPKPINLGKPINLWMDRQRAVYPYNVIQFSNKEELTSDTWCIIDELQKDYAMSQKLDTQKIHIVWFYLYEISRKDKYKFIETEDRLIDAWCRR